MKKILLLPIIMFGICFSMLSQTDHQFRKDSTFCLSPLNKDLSKFSFSDSLDFKWNLKDSPNNSLSSPQLSEKLKSEAPQLEK